MYEKYSIYANVRMIIFIQKQKKCGHLFPLVKNNRQLVWITEIQKNVPFSTKR